MSNAAFENMVSLFAKELRLCKVGSGEKVAVLTEGDQFQDRAQAFSAAAKALGADVVTVNFGSGQIADPNDKLANIGHSGLGSDTAAMAALKEADIVIDMMLLLFSHEQLALQAAGTRILMVVEPMETLERLLPSEELRRRVEAGGRRLKGATLLRFTNAAGSDVTYDLNPDALLTAYGYTDTPGRWDHWPAGFVATCAQKNGVNGQVVLDRGDIIYPLLTQLEEPIHFTVKAGHVTAIDGGAESASLRAYMENYEDPRAYAISHIGWGLNDLCQWSTELPGIGQDGRAYYGNVLFSTGPDTEFGGDNDTPCHLDMPMRNCSLYLDDELIVDAGSIVPDDMRVEGR